MALGHFPLHKDIFISLFLDCKILDWASGGAVHRRKTTFRTPAILHSIAAMQLYS
jgi:hypothetical protein